MPDMTQIDELPPADVDVWLRPKYRFRAKQATAAMLGLPQLACRLRCCRRNGCADIWLDLLNEDDDPPCLALLSDHQWDCYDALYVQVVRALATAARDEDILPAADADAHELQCAAIDIADIVIGSEPAARHRAARWWRRQARLLARADPQHIAGTAKARASAGAPIRNPALPAERPQSRENPALREACNVSK